MSYFPLLSPSKLLKRATPPLQRLFPSAPVPSSDVGTIFSKLRQTLDGGAQPLDAMLAAIADGARVMSGANGIALALGRNGTVVCRARAGEIAPQIGAQLSLDSGISGECFRTVRALLCDDTQTDDRVDPEVCRLLGIRSIAVVPVRGREETVGILEALSSHPHAFTGKHLSLLQRLAEIAEVANDRELGAEFEVSAPTKNPGKIVRLVPMAASIPEQALRADLFGQKSIKKQRPYWMAAGIALALILVSTVIWISLSDTDADVVGSQQATQSQAAAKENPIHPAAALIPRKPTTGRIQARADGFAVKGPLQSAAIVEPEPPVDSEVPSSGLQAAALNASQPSSTSEISSLLPPEVEGSAPDTAAVAPLLSTTAILPTANLAISQGVTGAILVHKVEPVYPSQAHARHLGGVVVLETTIGEDGKTRDVKIISGPPLLAEAASQAVNQWRYRPSRLNGKPVAVQKQITIVFKNP